MTGSITILMYHEIGSLPPKNSPFRGLTVDSGNFRKQMIWLQRLGYVGLSLAELVPYIKGDKQGKVFGITFDDGFQGVYNNALPVLQQLGFTATCFFVSGQIGGYNQWDEAIGVPYTPCMSKEELLNWGRAGNEIGAHTVDHVHLASIDPEDAFNQIRQSKIDLEEISGKEIISFAYPYGEVSEQIRQFVLDAGFKYATTIEKAQATALNDNLLLPRRNVRLTNNWVGTAKKVIWG